MKKLFYILLVILCILVLIYLFKNDDIVLNKEYNEEDIVIEYPYFNNSFLDTKIINYLNDKISSFKYNDNGEMFIDYDYSLNNDELDINFYSYEYLDNNIIKKEVVDFVVNLDNEEIMYVDEVGEDLEYDIYMNRVIDTNKPMIALTFDDGPSHNTGRIIDILNKYGVKATFFVLGVNILGNEDIVERLYDSGMEIGSHMYSHKLLTRMKEDKIREEYDKTRNLIYNIIYKYPSLTRPSYGSVNKKVKNIIDSPIIGWNIDTLDWKYHSSNNIEKRILNKVGDGSIILMHDIYSATANALDSVIPKLLESGYQLVTVSELFYYKNIELENGKMYRYAR